MKLLIVIVSFLFYLGSITTIVVLVGNRVVLPVVKPEVETGIALLLFSSLYTLSF